MKTPTPLLLLLLTLSLALTCVCAEMLRYDWYQQNPSNVTAAKPLPRYHHAAASFGNTTGNNTYRNESDSIVVVGGFDFIGPGVFLNDTWVFHTRNNTWRFVNSSTWTNLTNRAYFTASTYRHEVIAFGGQGANGEVYGDVWRFREFRWEQDTYHPNVSDDVKDLLKREYHAADVIGDVLYVFGGHSGRYGFTTNELFAYNITSRNWTVVSLNVASGPPGRQGHTLNAWRDPVLGDSLILFGGYSDRPYTGGYNDAWQYVIKENKWYSFNSIGAPAGRSGHGASIVGNVLYIQGGYSIQNIDKPPTYDVYYGDTWSLTLNGGGASKWAQVTDDTAFGVGRRQGQKIVNVNNILYSTCGYVQYVGLDASIWAFVDA